MLQHDGGTIRERLGSCDVTVATAEPSLRPSPPHHHLAVHGDGQRCAPAVIDHLAHHGRSSAVRVLIIAGAERRRLIHGGLRARGLDPDDGRFRFLDAEATLDRVLDADGRLSLDAYHREVMAPHLAGDDVIAYGELVDRLARRGRTEDALAIERLVDELRSQHGAHVLCGYDAATLAGGGLDVATTLDHHSHVLAYDHPAVELDPSDPLRTVAIQQRRHERREQAAAMAVHDLRTPISVIVALLGTLREAGARLDAQQLEDCLAAAVRSATQLQRLADDLLEMARLDSGGFAFEPAQLDLAQLITDEVQDLSSLTGRRIEVTAPQVVPPVWADAGRQRQIVANLLSNAIRFSPPDTPIEVAMSDGDDAVTVHVRDHGEGIATHHLDEVFEPFTRLPRPPNATKEPPTGSGLGLAITRALVEGQGGSIRVASEEGRGTTFTYTVPILPS